MPQSNIAEVAVLIVCFNGRNFLADCLKSVSESDDAGLVRHIIVIDNASTDDSADLLRNEYPQIELLSLGENRGFAAANNAGWEYARDKYPNLQYLAILNHDTIVQSGWLTQLTDHLQHFPTVAAAQPKILLWPQKNLFNTTGNQSHYLGFGMVSAYGQIDDGSRDQIHPIDFPSGAALVVRVDVIKQVGLFDDLFFLYLEDADLGWKLRQTGWQIDYVPTSVIWHKYTFQRDYQYYFYLERNRWILLGTYYKTLTLLVLMPMAIAMEIGQLFFAWRKKILGQKFRAWLFFAKPANLAYLLRRRRQARNRRRISDRLFTQNFIAQIEFPEIKSRTLYAIGNPLLKFYWRIARRLIIW